MCACKYRVYWIFFLFFLNVFVLFLWVKMYLVQTWCVCVCFIVFFVVVFLFISDNELMFLVACWQVFFTVAPFIVMETQLNACVPETDPIGEKNKQTKKKIMHKSPQDKAH